MTEKTIECFACNEIIRATTDSRRSPEEKDIGSIAKKRRKKRKRFRLTMPPEEKTPRDENQETDRFYMPESFTIHSNNAQDQYTPDTPESASCMLFHLIVVFYFFILLQHLENKHIPPAHQFEIITITES